MGKADVERDYYGDLELEPTADPNEIKRQFKKLGMVSFLNSRNALILTILSFQLLDIIPIGIQAKSWNITLSFKPYNPPMRCSQTHNNGRSMTHSACELVCYIPILVALLRLQDRMYLHELLRPIFLLPHAHRLTLQPKTLSRLNLPVHKDTKISAPALNQVHGEAPAQMTLRQRPVISRHGSR